MEAQLDDRLEEKGFGAEERKREIKKLVAMEKHERGGHILELEMLRQLNDGDP